MSPQPRFLHSLPALTVILASLVLMGCNKDSDSSDEENPAPPALSGDVVKPVVFVHGGAGSAAQYMTQAMRFASNGYPEDLFYAFEYPGVAPHDPAALDAFIDNVLAETGQDQVYLVGHSMGTFVGVNASTYTGYLHTPEYAAKVAKYIGIDGATAETCPGDVPCMGIFDNEADGVLGENTAYLPDQEHVESATSRASFALQFEFLTGLEPDVTEVVPQEGRVQVSGRAVLFPANTGTEGGTLEIWEIDPTTGFRSSDAPLETFAIGADGHWGPAGLDPQAHYEMALMRPDRQDMHFYRQPIVRNTGFVRLNASAADSQILANTNAGPNHSTLVVTREREWIAQAPDGERDELWISTTSPFWGDQDPVNAIIEAVENNNIGLHIHDDAATPAHTSLELLDWFPDHAFQTGIDVYMPATTSPDGTITLRSIPRGDESSPQVLNVPNWASDAHRISVIFSDWW